MKKEVIKSGRTIDEAKNAALLELGLTENDLYDVEVLKMPAKKILGLFGGSDAEVKISIEVADEPKKVAAKPQKKTDNKKAVEKKTVPAKKEEKAEKEIVKAEPKASLKETTEYKKAEDYIKTIVNGLGLEKCEIKTLADDEEIVFELDCGEDYGIVIGRRGETLDAIQYLTRMVATRGISGYKRVTINIGNYREKRANALIALAKKNAARAIRTGRNITLEPMNPYERRIIHTAVQEIEGATSFSVGQDLDRRVVIASENSKGKYEKSYDRRGGRNNDRRPKREPYVPQIAPDREQKSDAAGVSLYGKIEVKKSETEE